jgi:glutaredoxin
MGEGRRCEVHGVALNASGGCLLCERRASGGARGASADGASGERGTSNAMAWLVGGVVVALLGSAVGFRVYRAGVDRRAEEVRMRSEPRAAAVAPAATFLTSTTSTSTTGGAVEAEPTAARPDPAAALREHEQQVVEAQRSVQIELYGAGWCPSCRKARAWLDAEGIAYRYRDTGDAVNKHTMRSLNLNGTIPTIDIEGGIVVGFSPDQMRAQIRRAAEVRVAKARR